MIPVDSEVWELGIAAPGKGRGLGKTTKLDCQIKVDPKVSHLFEAYHSTTNNPNVDLILHALRTELQFIMRTQ